MSTLVVVGSSSAGIVPVTVIAEASTATEVIPGAGAFGSALACPGCPNAAEASSAATTADTNRARNSALPADPVDLEARRPTGVRTERVEADLDPADRAARRPTADVDAELVPGVVRDPQVLRHRLATGAGQRDHGLVAAGARSAAVTVDRGDERRSLRQVERLGGVDVHGAQRAGRHG